jgi:CubicO group peptidase (beta-lactamase class C family)
MTNAASGDEELAARLNRLVKHRAPAAAAVITPEETKVSLRGSGERSDFEIGSISKGITALLYHDALERAEITAETRLGDVLPLGECAASHITLASLSTHHSGLSRLPESVHPVRGSIDLWRRGTNPYGHTLEELVVQARASRVGPPRPLYSNFGFMLLGHAVASAAGSTYAELLRTRMVEPLGLRDTYVPATVAEIRPDAVEGSSGKRPRQPWTGEALGPAGGIRASVSDMVRVSQAILDGSAPGVEALTPAMHFGPRVEIGAAWITIGAKGRSVTWHNGGTGGFRSWIGFDRRAKIAVVVLSANASSVDRAGFVLLAEASKHARDVWA